MDFGTYVRVRSTFFGISVVFASLSTHYASGGVAGLLVPSSLLILGAPVAPPTLPVFFSLRSAVVRATKELVLRPAPPDWASASLSFRLGARRVPPGPLLLCRRGLSSLCGLVLRSARPWLRSSGFSVGSYFAVIAVFTQFLLAFLDLRGFLGAKVTSHKSSTLSSHQMS